MCSSCHTPYDMREGVLMMLPAEPGDQTASAPLETKSREAYELRYQELQNAKRYNSAYKQKLSKRWSTIREFQLLKRLLGSQPRCGVLLDLPCGGGRLTPALAPFADGIIEADVALGQVLHSKASPVEGTNQFWMTASALNIPLRDNSVDGVVSCRLNHHLPDPDDGTTSPGFHLIDMERSVLFPYDIFGTRMARRDLLALSSYIVRYEGSARIPSFLSAYGLPQDEHGAFMEALCRFRSSSVGRDLAAMEFGIRAALERRWGLDISGWLRTQSVDNKGQSLEIYCRPNHPEWIQIAKQYWNAELPGMVEIKSHDWGGITQSGQVPGVGTCYFKRFAIRSLRFIHKPRRGRHTLKHQELVSEAGFDVPEVVCLIERRKAGIVLESALIASELKDQHSLNAILNSGNGDIVRSRRDKRELLRTLGREVGRRHALGLFHGDLHLGNVFCKRAENGFALSWIDNEEGSCWKHLPMRLRLHDLDHINRFKHKLSLSERMLVWKTYVLAAGLPRRLQRKILRRVIRKSQRFWRKKGWTS